MIRRFGPWLALAVVVVVALGWAAWPSGEHRSVAARVRGIASELRCVDCESLSVADSSTASARAQRADIRARIEAGQSDGEIRRAYVDRYGESILLRPASDGVSALVWILPVLVVVIGAGGLTVALRRWRRVPRLHATDDDRALVEREREA